MTWLNTGYRRRDIVGGIVKNQWVIVQPSGAKFSNDHNDPNVYLNGVVVDPLIAVYYDIPNELSAVNPPLNGRMGAYISVATATAAPTAGEGTIETIQATARGRKQVFADTVGKVVAEWDARTGKTTALGEDLGPHADFAQALVDITIALQNSDPPESPDGTVVPDDEDHIIDSDLNRWEINTNPALGFVGAVFLNQVNTGGVADWLLYLTGIVYVHNPNTGHFYHLVGTAWIDDGITDPRLPTPSIDFFTVPDDGAFLIDDAGVRYELGSAAGSGFNVLKGGVQWTQPDGGGAWADKIKIADGTPPRIVCMRNPITGTWVHATGTTWTGFHSDHEGGPDEPVEGTTIGTISGGSLNVVTVASTDGFAIGDDVFVQPLTGEGQGPGGQWPYTVYANAAARNASLGSHSEGKFVGQLDDGYNYVKLSGAWERCDSALGGSFYGSRIRAIGHWGRITNIVGNALTLNRTAQRAVTNAIVHWDGGPDLYNWIQNAANGASPASRTVLNANDRYPGRLNVALCGHIVPQNKSNIRFTCNARDSIRFYSPPGAPCLCFQWWNCSGIIDELVEKVGNWTKDDYGPGWQGSTVPNQAGYLGDQNPGAGQIYPSGTEFYAGSNNEQRDQTVRDVPTRAGGAIYGSSIAIRRVKNIMTSPLQNYIQWQIQLAGCDTASVIEDCEVDSVAIIAGFEIFRGGGSIFRPKGHNATIAVNNASGWVVGKDPNNPGLGAGELRFDPGCIVPIEGTLFFSQFANGTRAVNINHNAGNELSSGGGFLNGIVVVQTGYLTSTSQNIAAVQVQDQLVNVQVRGLRATFPSTYVSGPGAMGIISHGPNARFSDCVVSGLSPKSGQSYNFFIIDGIDEGGLVCDPGGKLFNWNIS